MHGEILAYLDSADNNIHAADLAWDEQKQRLADYFCAKAQAEATMALTLVIKEALDIWKNPMMLLDQQSGTTT